MSKTRIYTVAPITPEGVTQPAPRLVRATSKARALAHVASEFVVELASQEDIATWAPTVKIEDADREGA